LIDYSSVRRLALAQLPIYRQIYSADFTLLDSYRIAKMLLACEQKKQVVQKKAKRSVFSAKEKHHIV